MSRRRRQILSPTLFPFLAVLVCTLGTLILLLALVAQNTSDHAQKIAEQLSDSQPPESVGPPESAGLSMGDVADLVEEEQFRLNELISFREAQTQDLEDQRTKLAHVEDHMRRIRERLQQIGRELEKAKSDDPLPAATADQIRQLKAELAENQLVVKRLREEVKTAKPRFVIVPHQGPNGTTRRPTYLECTSEGVTIWPEGITITKWQLEQTNRNANPLDDALRAARYHVLQVYEDDAPPYPMLLVRPDGIDSYYLARAAMLDWDDQFGYELVPREVNLAYPKPDSGMRQRLESVIKQAVDRQRMLSIAEVRRRGAAQSNGGTRYPSMNSSGRGNVEVPRATGQRRVPPRLSVTQMDRQGRQSGFRDHRMFPTHTYAQGADGSTISAEDAKRRLERQLQDATDTLSNSDTDQQWDGSAQTAIDPTAVDQTAVDQTAVDQTAVDQTAVDQTAVDEITNEAELDRADRSNQSSNNASSGKKRELKGLFAPDNAPDSGADKVVQPGISDVGTSRSKTDELQPSSIDNPAAIGSMKGANATPQQPPSMRPINRSDVDWALPSRLALARGNEIVRSLRMVLHADRLVLLESASGRETKTFSIESQGMLEATMLLASELRERIDRWGAAAPGARWSPRLQVLVAQGAEERLVELKRLMTGSGITIQRLVDRRAETETTGSLR